MKIEFNSLKLPNQRIKLIIEIYDNSKEPKKLTEFQYNNENIFNYTFLLEKDAILFKIFRKKETNSFFHKVVIGSFIYDQSIKFAATDIIIKHNDKNILDNIAFGFCQKDFLYSIHKKGSHLSIYKSKYQLPVLLKSRLKSINFLKQLVSEPSNIVDPKSFTQLVNKNINLSKVSMKIHNEKKIKKIGLNCLLAVNQGSKKEPYVVEFFEKNKRKKNVDILFVGKGVCFDSGGISLKPSAGMEEMKWDMGGAAVTAAIIKYLSEIKTNFSYAGIVGLVENMPSGSAYKPGDIIKSYKGINVEVLNTDAEGRLVLADIITYGCEIYKPKLVIDFATLTGAIVVALGQHYAGMFSNDDKLSDTLYKSGMETNEKVWRMPLHEDFNKELNSPFVDLKNISAGRYGGSVTAAQFLQRFVPSKTKWAHLDIAGTTWKNNGDILNSKGATGFGLTLIADFIDRYFKN